jgi:hypothetical protein
MLYDAWMGTRTGMKREIELIKYGIASGAPPLVAAPDEDPKVGEGN